MTNHNAILSAITADIITDGIHERYCETARCGTCPVGDRCNDIFDKLEADGQDNSVRNIILSWLKEAHT